MIIQGLVVRGRERFAVATFQDDSATAGVVDVATLDDVSRASRHANAKLPHALILSGRCMNNSTLLDLGIKSLRWLIKIQISEAGSFRPVGSNGFYPRGKKRALFDQQPIEAQATVSACIEAFQATNDAFWIAEAFWFRLPALL